jgi:signal transduction histidine kinase
MADRTRTEVNLRTEAFPQHLADLFRRAKVQEVAFRSGQTIFDDGAQGHEAYFVQSGSVRIVKRTEQGGERLLNVIEAGAIFGEMALLDQPQRSATAVAAADCSLFVIPRAKVQELIASVPQLALWMLQIFSRRLRLADQSLAQMEKVQELNTRILMAHDTERRRIAREIQEGPAQAFADYIMRLDICQHLLKKGGDPGSQVSHELSELKAALEKGLARIQSAVAVLTPESVRTRGLVDLLRRHVEGIEQDSGLRIRLSCAQIPDQTLGFHVENTIYCLTQAALSNIQGFCRASNVEVQLALDERALTLKIADDGSGFDVKKVKQGYYREEMENFEAMRSRVVLVGGRMRLQSRPGEGTVLEIEIPRPADPASD